MVDSEAVVEEEISLDEALEETLSEIKSRNEGPDELEEVEQDTQTTENEEILESESEPEVSGELGSEIDGEPEPPEPETIDPVLANPPSTWRAGAKAKWASIDPEIRAEIQKREQDSKNGVENLKSQVEGYNEIQDVMRPYEAIIRSEGGTTKDVVQSMLESAYMLRQGQPAQKVQMVAQLANQYGFFNELAAYLTNGRAPVPHQAPQGLTEDAVLKLWEQKNEEVQSKRDQEASVQLVTDFQMATNEDGTLKYPYFENVRDMMANIVNSSPDLDLEQAYEQALWANPETRALVTQQDQAKREAEAHAEKAAKAKQANVRPTPSHGADQPENTESLDETMDATLARIKARDG